MESLLSDKQIRRRDIDTLQRFIRYRIGGYQVAIKNCIPGMHIFRGVRWATRPTTIPQFSYCPAAIAPQGRANRAGESFFYSCMASAVVFFEMRAKKGDMIALSMWEIREPLWLHFLGYHNSVFDRWGTPEYGERAELLNPIPGETKFNFRLRRQLADAFTEDVQENDAYRYKQTIAIKETFFKDAAPMPIRPGGPQCDRAAGLVYPTVRLRGIADNVAFFPEFVDRSLRLLEVFWVLVEEASDTGYVISIKSLSRSFPDGKIEWLDAAGVEAGWRSHIAIERDKLVCRDGYGNIYLQRLASRSMIGLAHGSA